MEITDEILWWMPLDYITCRIKKPFKKFVLSAHSASTSFAQVLGKMKIVKDISNPIAFIDWHWLMFCYWVSIWICFKIKIRERLKASLVGTLKEAFAFWYRKCFETLVNIVTFFWYEYSSTVKDPSVPHIWHTFTFLKLNVIIDIKHNV